MLPNKKKISILLITIGLVACNKGTGIEALDLVLADTQTKPAERTQTWYESQDRIRTDVLDVCLDYFKNETLAKANPNDPNLPRIVYDMNRIEDNLKKVPDCQNALNAANLVVLKEHESKTLYDSEVAEVQNNFNTTTTDEEIERLAAEVAKNLEGDQQNTLKNDKGAEIHAESYLAPNGKLEKIMEINDSTLSNADQALSDFAKKE